MAKEAAVILSYRCPVMKEIHVGDLGNTETDNSLLDSL
jgi:hypothetical protein